MMDVTGALTGFPGEGPMAFSPLWLLLKCL